MERVFLERLPVALASRLDALCAGEREAGNGAVPTGVASIDGVLPGGGLKRGGVHEWMSDVGDGAGERRATGAARGGGWSAPLALLVHLARAAWSASRDRRDHQVWIGRAVWPYPPALFGGENKRLAGADHSLFVRAACTADRLWAADIALRSGVVAVAVVDGSRFDMRATRRLQLAAEAGGALCMLARPAREVHELSAATTRWLVTPAPSPFMTRRWTVELLRCKGMRSSSQATCLWTLEFDHATRSLRVASDVLDRPRGKEEGRVEVRSGRRRRTA